MQKIPEKLLDVVKLAGQPAAFKKHFYKRVLDGGRHFYWTEKTDGLRAVLVAWEGCLYRIVKGEYVVIDSNFPSADAVVLDTELYEGKYYIFDCYYLNESLAGEKLLARLGKAEVWLEKADVPYFVLKTFREIHGIGDLEEALAYLFMEASPVSGNLIDGVILQDDAPVADIVQYKWKKNRLITTDFFLRYNACEKNYTLFVMGGLDHCKPMKKISFAQELQIGNTQLRPISIPLKENIHLFTPRANWDHKDYTPREIQKVEELMDKALQEPSLLDGKIVEMSPAEDGWVPLRLRDDKIVPNAYKVAFDNILSYFEYPAFFEKEMYYENQKNTELTDLVHRISHAMRESQFEKVAKYIPEGCEGVLDIACGRGGDYEILADMGIKNIFGIDNVFNCAKYAIRANADARPCYLNLIPGYLTGQNEEILKDIRSRAEFPPEGFSFFVIDYAIHYLLEIPGGMGVLKEFISSLAAPGAIMLFTAFDGEAMLADADAGGVLDFESFKASGEAMLADADAGGVLDFGSFKATIDRENHTAMMALPTIKGAAQRERLFMNSDLEDLGFTLLESFSAFAEKEETFRKEGADSGILRYYGYMKAFIVRV